MKKTYPLTILSVLFFLLSYSAFSQMSIQEKMKLKAAHLAERKKSSVPQPLHPQAGPYDVSSIPYAPYSFEGTDSTIVGQDDIYSPPIDMGFDFCYFGTPYHYVIIGANGELSFDTTWAYSNDEFVISGPLQNSSDVINNTICAVYRDVDPSLGGKIYYSTSGVTPSRLFIVNWNNIPLYEKGTGTCDTTAAGNPTPNSTFQLVIEEMTGNIRIYVSDSYSCSEWNGGYGIIGVLDAFGNAVTAPGRDYPATWTVTDEAWQFTSTGSNCITGIDKANQPATILPYPNPTKGTDVIQTKSYIGMTLEVYDPLGQKVISGKITEAETVIDLKDFRDGVYLIRIVSNGRAVVVQHARVVKEE